MNELTAFPLAAAPADGAVPAEVFRPAQEPASCSAYGPASIWLNPPRCGVPLCLRPGCADLAHRGQGTGRLPDGRMPETYEDYMSSNRMLWPMMGPPPDAGWRWIRYAETVLSGAWERHWLVWQARCPDGWSLAAADRDGEELMAEQLLAIWRRWYVEPGTSGADAYPVAVLRHHAMLTPGAGGLSLDGARRYPEPQGPAPARDGDVAGWMAQCTARCGRTRSRELYASYKAWCGKRNERPVNETAFGRELTGTHGLPPAKSSGVMHRPLTLLPMPS